MSRSLFVLVVSICLVSSSIALGAGKKQSKAEQAQQAMNYFHADSVAEKAEYTSALFSSHLDDVDRYMNAYVKEKQDTRAIDANKAKREKLAAQEKARKSEEELIGILKHDNEEITQKETEFARIKGRLTELEEFTQPNDVDRTELAKLKKEHDELDRYFKNSQRPTRKDPGSFSKGAQDANTRLKGALEDANAKAGQFQAKYEKLENALSGPDKIAFENEGFEKGIDAMLGKMKESYYDARLLLTDFDTLESKHKITGLKLDILKAKAEERLNKTLIGNFVNEQIKKAMSKICELAKKCPTVTSIPQTPQNLAKDLEVIEGQLWSDPSTPQGGTAGKASQ